MIINLNSLSLLKDENNLNLKRMCEKSYKLTSHCSKINKGYFNS